MARIRSIHPGVFTDEAWATVSIAARWLAAGLLTEADDSGVFEWKPVQIKMRLFPADTQDVPSLLSELVEAGIACRFDADGKPYGALKNFCRYQRPRKPKAVHPLPDIIAAFVAIQARSVSQKSEQDEDEADAVPQKSELAPQMEDGGGNRKEETQPAQHSRPAALRDRKELDRIEGLCRQAAKLENAVSPELFNLSPILALLDAGYGLEGDILPILKAKAGKNVRTWRFFVPAIEESRAQNQKIAPAPARATADWQARARHFANGGWRDEWGDRRNIPPEYAHLFKDAA